MLDTLHPFSSCAGVERRLRAFAPGAGIAFAGGPLWPACDPAAFRRGIPDRWDLARREGPWRERPPRWSASRGPRSSAGTGLDGRAASNPGPEGPGGCGGTGRGRPGGAPRPADVGKGQDRRRGPARRAGRQRKHHRARPRASRAPRIRRAGSGAAQESPEGRPQPTETGAPRADRTQAREARGDRPDRHPDRCPQAINKTH